MLRGRNLHAQVGGKTLFDGLDFDAEPGAITVVVGPNGAGKSTLLRGLCGLQPMAGELQLGQQPLARIALRDRARAIAYLPQRASAAVGLTVEDVVMLGRLPHRSRFAGPCATDRRRVEASLRQVGAEMLRHRQLRTLSGGERQRVMLARMLATEAATLILDEPTDALDIRHALLLLGELQALARAGRSVVLALHDLTLADRFGDNALCLHSDPAGTTTAGPAAEVFEPARLQAVFGVTFRRDRHGGLTLGTQATPML